MKINLKNIFFLKIIIIVFYIYLNIYNLKEKNEQNSYVMKTLYDNYYKNGLNIKNISAVEEVFTNKNLYITDSKISPEYIKLIKTINSPSEPFKNISLNKNIDIDTRIFENRDKISKIDYYNLCQSGQLIEKIKKKFNNPLISIIVPSFNKEKEIIVSIRSIQNQSFKNIEIIIVDDFSSDNSREIYNYLQQTDSRIRIFYHLKNLGVWRTRLDGFLYSRGNYIIFFDAGDLYADNYVLEDSYDIMRKYNLDSFRFAFEMIKIKNNTIYYSQNFTFKTPNKIILGYKKYDVNWYTHGTIWNRMIKKNIIFKSLELIDSYIINAYKNLWEDRWWNTLTNINSYRNVFINRIGYIYIKRPKGEGSLKLKNKKEKNKTLQEFIYFWLFDFQMSPKKSNKKNIIKMLRKYKSRNNKHNLNFSYLTDFTIFHYLLQLLLNDPYVDNSDKIFIKQLLFPNNSHF